MENTIPSETAPVREPLVPEPSLEHVVEPVISDSEAPAAKEPHRRWSREDALNLYSMDTWGSGYFSVNDKGLVTMLPTGEGGPSIAIFDVIEDMQAQGISLPCIIRFQDILRDRVVKLNETFKRVIQEQNYRADYRGVYPIKVNQLREVVEEIVDAGRPYHYGLEAGSKAELQVVLAYNTDPEAVTICNGYKDSEYIRLALLGRQLDRKIIIVIEQLSELPLTIRIAKELGVQPILGFRGKLASSGAGKWEKSGGELAKFGLSMSEMLEGIQMLKDADMLSCLELVHSHVGSQIPEIRTIREAMVEVARLFVSIREKGAPLKYLDLGGGLGIDYDGSQSNSDYSINYTLDEYVMNAVTTIRDICDEKEIPHPHLITESGRAITAHHACLVMKVVETIDNPSKNMSRLIPQTDFVQEIQDIVSKITPRRALEVYHDVMAKREEALNRFKLGLLSIEERAFVEEKVKEVRRWIFQNRKRMKRASDELEDIVEKQASQYLVNFSVFQSAPDHWAFDQLFPIVPLHRMNEEPRRMCSLVDITCDSDGVIDRFIDRREAYKPHLWLHQLNGKPYYIGMFLTGAYQDIMGDLHNLFGRVNEVHVFCDDDDPEDFYIQEVIPGDTISSVVQENLYSPAEMVRFVRTAVEEKVKEGKIKPRDGVQLIDFYEKVMQGYTYLRT